MEKSHTILGAIAGDVIGSVYEWHNIKTTEFPLFSSKSRFTDDTVLTVAVAEAILTNQNIGKVLWDYGNRYTDSGFGGGFRKWLSSPNPQPYRSYGNGSAMRVSPVGFAFENIAEVLNQARLSAIPTHDHPEGIKGAEATASAIFLARKGESKKNIRNYISEKFKYNLDFKIDQIRPHYKFDVSCQGSVPQSIVAFLESTDYENAIRLAVSIGGDTDTIACICGGIAAAFYKKIAPDIIKETRQRITPDLLSVIDEFNQKFGY